MADDDYINLLLQMYGSTPDAATLAKVLAGRPPPQREEMTPITPIPEPQGWRRYSPPDWVQWAFKDAYNDAYMQKQGMDRLPAINAMADYTPGPRESDNVEVRNDKHLPYLRPGSYLTNLLFNFLPWPRNTPTTFQSPNPPPVTDLLPYPSDKP